MLNTKWEWTQIALVVLGVVIALAVTSPTRAVAAPMLAFPSSPGSEWSILAGYNTITHSVADANDPYAIDLWRLDAPTADSPVLAPASGTVTFVSSSCVTIRDAAGTRILLCHILAPQTLRNTTVARGQLIGTVAPPGQAGNNGTSHIHLALSNPTGGPMPFVGNYALEGTELPATTVSNAYADTRFRSTIVPAPTVEAGADQTVRPRTSVTLLGQVSNPAGGALRYQWTQVSGSSVTIVPPDALASTFTAPVNAGMLQFRLAVTDDTGDSVSDTVTVQVSGTAPIAATVQPTTPVALGASAGRITSGTIPPAGGFGIIVFGGGTNDQLVTASGCPRATTAFWASQGGNFVTYVPASTVTAVNQPWSVVFPGTIPAGTALLGKCR